MADTHHPVDRDSAAHSQTLTKASIVFALVTIALAVVGVVLLVAGNSWVSAVGIALIALAGIPAVIGFGRLSYAALSHRAARRRPVA